MLLKQLLKGLEYTLVQGDLNAAVSDIYYDSRKVTTDGLFVCIVGTQRDSHDYAADVVEKGASVLVIQHDLPGETLNAMPQVTVVKFENTRYAMAMLSSARHADDDDRRNRHQGQNHHHPHDEGRAGCRRPQNRHDRH